jgi:Xaa-Pro aminopeptidase
MQERAAALGIPQVRPLHGLAEALRPVMSSLRTLASTDPATNHWLTQHTGRTHAALANQGSPDLIEGIISLRSCLDTWEIEATRAVAQVTDAAHRAAMATTRAGSHEARVGAIFDGVIAAHGLTTAYDSIVTVHGEVLHNFHRDQTLVDGQLLLLDGGAEGPNGYATDVTRTWPVNGRFSPRQKAVYEAVLEAEIHGIELCQPGTRYRDIHLASARVLTRFLIDEGLLVGTVDSLVERGAHALFFPHGVGHLIGLDVHDLELYGDTAGYAPGRVRSTQFGLNALRLDRDLTPGNVVTIEPGLYIVPAILNNPDITAAFKDCFNRSAADSWLGFGGIRIEDDVHVTDAGPEVLTSSIPKTVDEVETAVAAELVPFW